MSHAVDLVEKNKVLLESIDTGNGQNKTIGEIRKNEWVQIFINEN